MNIFEKVRAADEAKWRELGCPTCEVCGARTYGISCVYEQPCPKAVVPTSQAAIRWTTHHAKHEAS